MKTGMSLRNDGFSLIEILVGVALLAILGTVIFNGFGYAARTHAKTTQLQMAEDVAQEVSEKFKAQSIDNLTVEYASYCTDSEDTDPDNVIRTIEFDGISWNYLARNVDGTNDNAMFTVDVKLTSKAMATDAETGMKGLTQTGLGKAEDALTAADYTGNMTTYKQHTMDTGTGVYVLDGNVGTNTFIIPEVVNIYDGKRIVISEDINRYDSDVATDMQAYIMDCLTRYNNSPGLVQLPQNLYNVFEGGSKFEEIYWPYSKIYDDGAESRTRINKKTTIEFFTEVVAGKVEYYYIVDVVYTLKFDYNLYDGLNQVKKSLNAFMDEQKIGGTDNLKTVAHNDDGTPSGVECNYTIKKPAANTYEISYSKEFNYPTGDPLDALNGKKGIVGGKFVLDDGTVPNLVTNPASATSADEVPYFYILYRPFDIYSYPTSVGVGGSYTNSTDEVVIKYSHDSSNKNCARVFFVVQDMNHAVETTNLVRVNNCKVEITGGSDVLKKYFKFYTNSLDIIEKNEVTGSNINSDNYLTNSYNQNHENLYDMEVTIYDHDGNVVAKVNSVKED